MRVMLKSKLHRARITQTNPDYEGSIGIDAGLLQVADILPFEQVHVLDITNGQRFETYVIEEERGSGRIGVYGAAARIVDVGDLIIVLAYALVSEDQARSVHPRVVFVDANNAQFSPKHPTPIGSSSL